MMEKAMTSLAFVGLLDSSDGRVTLEKGVYRWDKRDAFAMKYSFSNSEPHPVQYIGALIRNRRDLVIDGQGSTLLFRGHMTPVALDGCENITLRNFVIDFDPPLNAEAVVVARGENTADVRIDRSMYPCEMKDGWLYFDIGEEAPSALFYAGQIHFGRDRSVTPGSGDDFVVKSVEQVGEDVFRLTAACRPADEPPYPGDRFVLRHNDRWHPCAFVQNCRNVTFEDVVVHNDGGLGLLCQFNENLTFRRVVFEPNTAAGREIFSGRDDGLHLTSNRGRIEVEDCSFVGLMDDPINVHGCSVKVMAVGGDRHSLRVRYMHRQAFNFDYYARLGDRISLIDQRNMASLAEYTVSGSEKLDEYELMLYTEEEIAQDGAHLALENISATADFICRGTRFGSCRARGLLVSTRGKVLIEENLFESSGAAILVAGDANDWYESGECHDMTIRRNVFTDRVLASMYSGARGMISILPEVPCPDIDRPFHKNIVIEDNVFYSPDTPVLEAFSTGGLVFRGNRIFRATSREDCTGLDSLIRLSWCRDVEVENNRLTGLFRLKLLAEEQCVNVRVDGQPAGPAQALSNRI